MCRSVPIRFSLAALIATSTAFAGCGGVGGTGSEKKAASTNSSIAVIAPDEGVRFGLGWDTAETYQGETFRWADNDAKLIACPDSKHRILTLIIEPGPSLGSKQMALSVRSSAGAKQVIRVSDRRPLHFTLSRNRPLEVLTLHVASKELPVVNENRRLNFRLFSAALGVRGNCGSDVLPDGASLKIGTGWYPLESFAGETFRWVKNDARLLVLKDEPNLTLDADIGLGPSLNGKPLALEVRTPTGKVLSTIRVVTRSYVTLRIGRVNAGDILIMHAENRGIPFPGDPRILNFRVFEAYPA